MQGWRRSASGALFASAASVVGEDEVSVPQPMQGRRGLSPAPTEPRAIEQILVDSTMKKLYALLELSSHSPTIPGFPVVANSSVAA